MSHETGSLLHGRRGGKRVVAVALFCVMGVACDEAPTTPTRDELAGRWLVVSLEPSSAPSISPRGVALALEFDGDRLSAQGDCNVCSGRYVLEERRLMLTPLACTRRACPQGSLDDPFFSLLEGELTATLNGAWLVIDGTRGRIVLRR